MQSPTNQTPSANRKLCTTAKPLAGRTGNKRKPAAFGTTGFSADGFLKRSFLPMYIEPENLPTRSEVETDILKGIRRAAAFYGIRLIDVKDKPYPHNILLAEWDLERKIRKKGRQRELRIIQNNDNVIKVSVQETLCTGNTLYYLPVVPLYRLIQNGEHQPCANLLTAIFSYLYIQAGVSYYRDEGTYLHGNYDILNDWIEDDRDSMDDEDYERNRKALDEANNCGDFVQERIMGKFTPQDFAGILQALNPVEPFEHETLRLGIAFFELWRHHPKTNLFSHASQPEVSEEEYYYNDSFIGIDDYVSFIASDKDCAYDELITMINNDFNERPAMQEPEIEVEFDNEQPDNSDKLAYEATLLELMGDLSDLLYELP